MNVSKGSEAGTATMSASMHCLLKADRLKTTQPSH
jgi:hypothetical protein